MASKGFLAVAAVAAAGALALATVASGAGISERKVTFTTSGAEEGTAECTPRQKPISGGFAGEFSLTGTAMLPLASTREGPGWGYRTGDLVDGEGEATAYVYCSKKRPKLKLRSATATIAPDSFEQVTATCKRKHRVISGGFEGPDAIVLVLASKRVGKGRWQVRWRSSSADPEEVTAHAYCSKRKRAAKLKQRKTEASAPEGDDVAVRTKCKRKRRVVSGGFEAELDVDAGVGAVPHASHRAGRRVWEAASRGLAGTADVTTYAYCEKRKGAK